MKSYLRIFAPWIACAAVWSVTGWQAGMLAGAVVAAVTAAGPIRRRSADLLSTGTIGYFAVMAGVAIVAPHSPLQHFTPALALATMGVLAAGSLAVRRPFTMAIARQMTSPDVWQHPLFYRTNAVISAVWTASFLTTAAACALLLAVRPPHASVWIGLVEAAGFLVPMRFTRTYPARVRARARTRVAA